MRSPLLAALALLASAVSCTTNGPGPAASTMPTVAYETRARAGERVEAPQRFVDETQRRARDPRDAIRIRAAEVRERSTALGARVAAASTAAREIWRGDLDAISARVQRLHERMTVLEELERRDAALDVERQWDGVFAEVQDLLAVLDELEVDVERATGPAGASAQRAAP
jgi:hypothetical protein